MTAATRRGEFSKSAMGSREAFGERGACSTHSKRFATKHMRQHFWLLPVSGGMTRECRCGDSTNGTGAERRGTGSGTGRTLKVINVYRPWYTGTGNYPGGHAPCGPPSGLRAGTPAFHRKPRRTTFLA